MPRVAKQAGRRDADLSARFTADEKCRVELAMAKSGKNLSDFVREAVLASADQLLADDAMAAFVGAIGVISVPGDFGRRADDLLADLLLEKHSSGRRRTRGGPQA
jgi:hypothetical protein